MKTISFITFAACVAASALMSSCSDEENTAASSGQLTAFTSGIVTEAPMTRVRLGASQSSTVAPGFLTRTSMVHPVIDGGGTFYWEPGDVIYVQDDSGNFFKSQNDVTKKTASYTFLVKGNYYRLPSYLVYYTGTSNYSTNQAVIAATQTQEKFNDTKHFGASGDCGVAKATNNTEAGKSGYTFKLVHKAAYLCFLPYVSSHDLIQKYKILSVKVTSGKNISGIYDIALNRCFLSGNESNTITLNAGTDGFYLPNEASITHSLYMVVAPCSDKPTIDVTYTVLDTQTNKTLFLTKSYGHRTLAANTIYDIPVDLSMAAIPNFYGGHNYYMWGAAKNYWAGHEWDTTESWQPKVNGGSNGNYPREGDAGRWYYGGGGGGGGAFVASANPLFKKLPNANEMAWYVKYGDAHWDDTTEWTAFGETHKGGVWLKKLSVIAQKQGKQPTEMKKAAPNGDDLLTSDDDEYEEYNISPTSGKPNDSEISNYFFLPVLGLYHKGELRGLDGIGAYWSSSPTSYDSASAYNLRLGKGKVYLNVDKCDEGLVAHPFE